MSAKVKNPWSVFHREAFPGTSFSPSSQLSRTNSNLIAQERKEGSLYNYPDRNWNGSPGPNNPAVNYGNKPSFDFSTTGVPRAAYPPKETKYSIYEGSELPYKIGRANMRPNY